MFWFAWKRQQYPILGAINAVVALGNLLMSGRHLDAAIRYNETPMLLFFAFEVSVVIVSALLFFGIRVPNFVVVLQAIINLVMMALLAAFLFWFRLGRLF